MAHRPADSFSTLLADDQRFDGSPHRLDAYAESWGLCHFLLQRYPKKFTRYLHELAQKEPLLYDQPDERLQLFERSLGRKLNDLDPEFVRYIGRLR